VRNEPFESCAMFPTAGAKRALRHEVRHLMLGLAFLAMAGPIMAGDRVVPGRQVYVVQRPPACVQPPQPLGTFYPQPYLTVTGTGMAGGGYAPLDMYGNVTLNEYGPLSAYRRVAAPVAVYSRGYDGIPRTGVGTAFSYPNMPPASQVIYPTRANHVGGFPSSGTPPFWDSSLNWIDQN
jgi:hypothetical protein